MTIDMSQFYQVFFDEAEELLAEMERLLLQIDIVQPDAEDLNAVFRSAHSIKGGAATFGITDMTEVTHILESLLDKIRQGNILLTLEHVNAFLIAKDVLKMQLDGHRNGSKVDQEAVADVHMLLQNLLQNSVLKMNAIDLPLQLTNNNLASHPIISSEHHFRIELPVLGMSEVSALKHELGLLGIINASNLPDSRIVLTLKTNKGYEDIWFDKNLLEV